ncbi:mechanosensitive ion channel domain-containing protein [Rhodovastum atsumiense]|uniref:Mechanosensitive ion channel n=1 Tax=Rhodovastum atsumiense TaxID=504468 RepID=A0A5M6IY55_9PROT|nr:mechanosensitive ion channel domain-containing protein [Rhodovastum atsumiense]KAA5613286.1 mechanosensitive ion channel [Rhodovastum atsumiense]
MILALLLLASALAPGAALAQAPAPVQRQQPALSRAQAESALEVLRDDGRRAQFINVLEAIARAAPPAAPASAPASPAPAQAAAGDPASPPPDLVVLEETAAPPPEAAAPGKPPPAAPAAPAAPAEAPALAIPLAPDSVAAQLLTDASEHLSQIIDDVATSAQAAGDIAVIGDWVARLATDAQRQRQLLAVGWRLLLVLSISLGAEYLIARALRRPARALANRAPSLSGLSGAGAGAEEDSDGAEPPVTSSRRAPVLLLLRRLPYAFGRLVLELVPLLVVLITLVLLETAGTLRAGSTLIDSNTTRRVLLMVLQSYIVCRVTVALVRFLVAPGTPRLRLLPVPEDSAGYTVRWTRRLAGVAVFGYAFAEIGLLFGMYRNAYDGMMKLLSLAVLVCLVIIVLQCRGTVAARLRAAPGGALAGLRNRLASIWHVAAISYFLALWLVWAFEVPNGFTRLLRVVASAVVIALLVRLLVAVTHGALERAVTVSPTTTVRHPLLEPRLRSYLPVARAVTTLLITLLGGVGLFQAWGFDAIGWFSSRSLGGRLLGSIGTIFTTLVVALVVWEAVNIGIQRHLARLAREAQAARSARLRTLLPMLRTTLLVGICVVSGLMILSEIGVNIAPLLAGAGVVGLAIGFGSQKLVQDIITGLFLLLENAMQVGDVVSLAGMNGTVEALSVRAIRLRALDGSVHIIPFSAVTTVTNMTRDFGYAVVDVNVGLNEDLDQVADLVRQVAKEMREEPRWESAIRDDLDVLGIEKFIDTACVLRTRIKTVPGQRWAVGRELNRRIKIRFDELAVESPWTSYRVLSGAPQPQSRVRLAEDLTGNG